MRTDKIIKHLDSIFEKEKINKSHCETLDDLLDELEKKQKRIKSKIDSESNKKKRKELKMELKIVKVQLRKGYDKRDALNNCK